MKKTRFGWIVLATTGLLLSLMACQQGPSEAKISNATVMQPTANGAYFVSWENPADLTGISGVEIIYEIGYWAGKRSVIDQVVVPVGAHKLVAGETTTIQINPEVQGAVTEKIKKQEGQEAVEGGNVDKPESWIFSVATVDEGGARSQVIQAVPHQSYTITYDVGTGTFNGTAVYTGIGGDVPGSTAGEWSNTEWQDSFGSGDNTVYYNAAQNVKLLPASAVTPPTGKTFLGWSIANEQERATLITGGSQVTYKTKMVDGWKPYEVVGDITATAVWSGK